MQVLCRHCGASMIFGRVAPTGIERSGEPALSFIAGVGTPTSPNPIKAMLQGMQHEPEYREEVAAIRGMVCPDCARVEFFLDPKDLTKIICLTKGLDQKPSRE